MFLKTLLKKQSDLKVSLLDQDEENTPMLMNQSGKYEPVEN